MLRSVMAWFKPKTSICKLQPQTSSWHDGSLKSGMSCDVGIVAVNNLIKFRKLF
jgi:hypothetical protein